MRRVLPSFPLFIFMMMLVVPSALQAQGPAQPAQKELLYTTYTGDVLTTQTPNPARMHVQGGFLAQSADYYRGRFTGIPESGDRWAFLPYLHATGEVWKDDRAMFREVNLTVGIWNGLGETNNFPDAHSPKSWYKAYGWVGLTSAIGQDWRTALTYSGYGRPNGQFATAEEFALAWRYVGSAGGKLSPQVKLAVPFSGGNGVYVEGSVKPGLKYANFKVDFPLVLGAGLGNYYGVSEDNIVYVQGSVVGTIPLKFIPARDFGSWNLTLTVSGILREHELSQFSRFDDAGNSVLYGAIGIEFAF